MKKDFVPYIGITDFDSPGQVCEMLRFFQNIFPDPTVRRLMIGVMMSYRTLRGERSGFTDVWPKESELAALFSDHMHAYNALHWADYEGRTHLEDIQDAVSQCGPYLHALQFDMVMPAPYLLREIKCQFGLDTILQVNRDTFIMAGYPSELLENYSGEISDVDPRPLLETLKSYIGLVDVFLLDLSMGQGKPINAALLKFFVDAFMKRGMDVAVGGGYGPGNMGSLSHFHEWVSEISWDAQAALHPDRDIKKPLMNDACKQYIVDSERAIDQNQ